MPAKKNEGAKKMTEEELLLLESSRHVSMATSALFYGNAFIVSALPLWLYWRIQMLDPLTYSPLFVIFVCVSTYLVAYAYRNLQHTMKYKIALRREGVISREVAQELSKENKQERDTKASEKKNKVADREATAFSIFYSNTLYFFILLVLFWFMRTFHPVVNFSITTSGSAFLLAFFSTGGKTK
ncbi:PREDICTED: translocon-associated protein subunit gamma-like [Amphimedon queenslandica]|uniref:Translocon-associated protein subunit gamma n=1 Tax=Amphimedon queenslandica TaxID=400682 RepID=A0A1X7VIC4_AMPQE|nr:PREDICTED: translocon-associated protein subunit gamma-like [Amphimedon queenslandica]|eukprot:XP_003384340.1 PREDICTED: translocon-associated protein subunit gamma-like [Amphimedon queenslandica]